MEIKCNLRKEAAAAAVITLPVMCGLMGQQSIITGQVALANNQLDNVNIECSSGQIEDPAWLIAMQKRQQAAEVELAELGVVIPEDIIRITERVGAEYNICPELLQAIIWQESRCISTVYNSSCKGLMQVNVNVKLNKDNISELAAEKNISYSEAIFDSEVNIETGARLLKKLFDDYGDDPAEILMRYNGDKTNLKKYQNGGNMSKYAENTLHIAELLERAHGK